MYRTDNAHYDYILIATTPMIQKNFYYRNINILLKDAIELYASHLDLTLEIWRISRTQNIIKKIWYAGTHFISQMYEEERTFGERFGWI